MRVQVAKATGEGFEGQNNSNTKAKKTSTTAVKKTPVVNSGKVGRNDPCPCGSGKKYKKCCGANNSDTADN